VPTSPETDPIAAIRALSGVRSATLHDDGSGVPVAVVVTSGDARRDRAMLRDEIVRGAAAAGVSVCPVVYDEKEWETVGRFVALDGPHPATMALAHHRATNPGHLRKSMVRIVRDLRMAVDAISEPQPIPYHVKLDVCARLVRDGMDLLFAVHDLPIGSDAAAIATFDQEFVRNAGFAARHATVGLRLRGLARQVELAYWATARDDEHRFAADAEVDEAAEFLRLLERHIDKTLTTDGERARGERTKRLAIAGIGPLLGVLFVAYLVGNQPEQPIANTGALSAPGAIVAEYFAGGDFDRKVLERADATIAVDSEAPPPDPRLGAAPWSARWSGYMHFDQAGRWHLCGRADEGQRIYLNHRLLVDDWAHESMRTACATVHVTPGWYPFRVEYHQATGPASLSILRGPPRRSLAAVPSASLCCGAGVRPPATS
jgi:hypothetical protein